MELHMAWSGVPHSLSAVPAHRAAGAAGAVGVFVLPSAGVVGALSQSLAICRIVFLFTCMLLGSSLCWASFKD